MSKHTPGPWYADDDGRIWRRSPNDLYQNGGGVAGDRPLALASPGWLGKDVTGYPFADNARLIAAAPDLLEALKRTEELLSSVDGMSPNNIRNIAAELLDDHVLPAIAKAEGR